MPVLLNTEERSHSHCWLEKAISVKYYKRLSVLVEE